MLLLINAQIISEGRSYKGAIAINNELIEEIYEGDVPSEVLHRATEVIDLNGKIVMPGVIDDQVHFRDPGLTHKGDMQTESMAAIAGGVTSFMDMPNTIPQTVDAAALDWKLERGAECAYANYGFYIGANNSNIDELKRLDSSKVCGVKVFMGSSTGNMLVDNKDMLTRIFSELPYVIATHCEKEEIIKRNIAYYTEKYGEDLPIKFHPLIRSEEACYASSSEAVELAHKHNTRLHLLHLSTAKELSLIEDKPLTEKRVTGEVCVHHLWFNDSDYAEYGNRIKWNPAIKTEADRRALVEGVVGNRIDVVATDHAPHLLSEKEGSCLKAASGGPLVQYSLLTMLELAERGEITLTRIVDKMCHAPAILFQIKKRGFIRKGYFADLVVVDSKNKTLVDKAHILSRCAWSPFEGKEFANTIDMTILNGSIVYRDGKVSPVRAAKPLKYEH